MKIFLFQKWFFDVSTAAGDYFFLFITRISIAGTDKIYLEAHGDGEMLCQTELDPFELREDALITAQGNILFSGDTIHLSLHCEQFVIDATWSAPVPQLHPFEIRKKTGRLSWLPLFIRARVNGEVISKGSTVYEFSDDGGYVDLVHSTFLPFMMPVKKLYWGRLFSAEADLTFTIARGPRIQNGDSRIYLAFRNCLIEFEEVHMNIKESKTTEQLALVYPEHYRIEAENGEYRLILEISGHKISVASDFINDVSQYNVFTRKMIALVSKNPRGIKSTARARLHLMHGAMEVFHSHATVVDEYVLFFR